MKTYILRLPAGTCPFCGPNHMSGGQDAYTSEYYYECSCGAGADTNAYPQAYDEDEDGGNPTDEWIIEEVEADNVREEYKELMELIGEDDE